MKYGKLPARPGAIQLQLSDYIEPRVLPTPPDSFGRSNLISDWGMLGNDSCGDCVLAGGAHETMLWNAMSGRKPVAFSDRSVISDYSAITGYSRWRPWSDSGTDMQEAAKYRQRTGLRDRWGFRHRIGAYVMIKAGDVAQHKLAAFLFGAIGIGIRVPETMDHQFENHDPFTPKPGAKIVGGHYMPMVGFRKGMFRVITWGQDCAQSPEFLEAYNDESIAYVSPEMLRGDQPVDGFDYKRLLSDLQQLQAK